MKTEHLVMIVAIALLGGLLIGYGLWGPRAAQVPAMEKRIHQLTAKVKELTEENQTLKTTLESMPWTPAGKTRITGGG